MMPISPSLRDVIEICVPQLHQHCRDPWVIIGSAAAALSGADVDVADLDVMSSVDDAERLKTLWKSRLNTSYEPAGAALFRSHFARFDFPGMPVEVMGGLEVYGAGEWQPVQVNEIVHIACAGVQVPIPVPSEQIRMLERFARPKDLLRTPLLRAL
jgi:hypothetical protein